MPKRKISEDFACPGCQEQFDPKTHIPYLGSCFHSLCGVCVNEKQIEVCNVCDKEGAFASKQKNDPAIELLTVMAEQEVINSKKLKFDGGEKDYGNEPIPAVLDPKNRPFLADSVNLLDPISFLKLSSTCKSLHNFCFNSKEIRIVYEISSFTIGYGAFGFKLQSRYERAEFYRYIPTDYRGYGCGFLGSMANRKKLRNYPFVFHIRQLDFDANLDSDSLAKTRSLFAEFPVRAVSHISVAENRINDWDGFIQFLKDFHIGQVHTTYPRYIHVAEYDPSAIPDEAAMYLLQNTAHFRSNFKLSENLILKASVPTLYLGKTSISKNTFQDLVMKFANSTSDLDWTICYNAPFGHYDRFPSLPVDHKGPLPSERPFTFYLKDHPEIFWILREDGKYLRSWAKPDKIEFLTTRDRNVPFSLIPWNDPSDVDILDSDSDSDW